VRPSGSSAARPTCSARLRVFRRHRLPASDDPANHVQLSAMADQKARTARRTRRFCATSTRSARSCGRRSTAIWGSAIGCSSGGLGIACGVRRGDHAGVLTGGADVDAGFDHVRREALSRTPRRRDARVAVCVTPVVHEAPLPKTDVLARISHGQSGEGPSYLSLPVHHQRGGGGEASPRGGTSDRSSHASGVAIFTL